VWYSDQEPFVATVEKDLKDSILNFGVASTTTNNTCKHIAKVVLLVSGERFDDDGANRPESSWNPAIFKGPRSR
jgi:hypothetical protein